MNDINYIIKDFEYGNETQRLLLFMTHRDLRPDFMKIAQRPNRLPSPRKDKKTGKFIQLSQWLVRKVFPIPVQ